MKIRIKTVIASVLKPVDDPRMYEKIGLSLQQTNRYDINIIGFVSKSQPLARGINFYPCYRFRWGSRQRWFASIPFFGILRKIKPSLLIITTYELLPAAIIYKFIEPDCRIVYDVQENYALNMATNGRPLIAKLVSKFEKISQKFIKLNLLAEKAYQDEMVYLQPSITVLNRYQPLNHLDIQAKDHGKFVMVFCGTISEPYGIWQSLALLKKLKRYVPNLIAKYIGHITNSNLCEKFTNLVSSLAFVEVEVDTLPVPHQKIIAAIASADFGIVAHQPFASIKNCFPTRIYEFMAHRLPFILQDHPPWVEYCKDWDCCIPVDLNNFDAAFVAEQMKTTHFYPRGVPGDIYWKEDEEKLIKALDQLFFINN